MNNTQPLNKPAANRRNYFRINQDVVFDYRPVDTHHANSGDAATVFEDSTAVGLLTELRRIDKSAGQNLKLLADKDPILGDYLQLLTNKIDLIARHTLLADPGSAPQTPKRINLSEAGVSFTADKAFYKGQFLAIRLIFLPSYVPILTFAEVIRCQTAETKNNRENDKHQIAARFHRLAEKDRQEMSRQILKAQVAHRNASGKAGTPVSN